MLPQAPTSGRLLPCAFSSSSRPLRSSAFSRHYSATCVFRRTCSTLMPHSASLRLSYQAGSCRARCAAAAGCLSGKRPGFLQALFSHQRGWHPSPKPTAPNAEQSVPVTLQVMSLSIAKTSWIAHTEDPAGPAGLRSIKPRPATARVLDSHPPTATTP